MKKILCIYITLFSLINLDVLNIEANEAVSYCVLSSSDNYVIDSYNDTHTQSVASISKIMTAIVVIENIDIKQDIVIDDSVLSSYGSSIYLQVGDVYTIEELLYGLMLRSGNDAAIQLASIVGGDVDTFVSMMNDKAKELNLVSTVFSNPSGLDEEDGGNISTSCEMAYIMAYAMNNDIFKTITSTVLYNPTSSIYWTNKNRFLEQYEYATGGKTGYTDLARRTLVTVSEYEGMEVIVVTLNCSDDFTYHEQLHDYAYDNYEVIPIIKEGTYHIQDNAYTLNEYGVTVNKDNHNIIVESSVDDVLSFTVTYKDRSETFTYE